jgi:hypothetical protein
MQTTKLGAIAAAVLTASAGSAFAQNLTLNFGPNVGSSIVFFGSANQFNFTPGNVTLGNPTGFQWNVTSESGSAATQSADGDLGSILNGSFTYGPIINSGAYQSATVQGAPGQLVISDGAGILTGTVNFIDISTYGRAGGFVNDLLDINLTGVTYSGSNPDLQFLYANQPGLLDLSFNFSGLGETLSQIQQNNVTVDSSYSGSISVTAVPEPSSLAMSVLGSLGALGCAFRRWNNS